MRIGILAVFIILQSCALTKNAPSVVSHDIDLFDSSRNRKIPATLYMNSNTQKRNHKLAVISGCYECSTTVYSFIANILAVNGYTVMSVQHELLTDEPLAFSGNIYELRKPVWERGVRNIQFVVTQA